MSEFTHFNEQGHARMVDVSEKKETIRIAQAQSSILVSEEVYRKITDGQVKKGDVLSVAQIAGIMAAKKTSDIIPMCHPLPLTGINITFQWKVDKDRYELMIYSVVKTKGNTGVEMEALTSASVCALTIYDMCKAIDRNMTIGPTYLLEKTGGKSGTYKRKSE
ncbi:cyclic pyranopterin monophosphate synthase MoaC [Terrilactibacillus sp. BCM23-1]|uniref:Cyclic pyranopterin monophosphate synthase n=1 Tax=Terrilactibacillus tamarindi TaxID=2599694 RepID=A0A6N8CQA0_9BACI|nr:cyclic pyranopterin monophosphate synthase MoaC [Terrilactibacillus tamarindi]MTT31830.1 cyclic pyranopterin monophosphate synthase MoaC [Terrilactibacillus tamarindi]